MLFKLAEHGSVASLFYVYLFVLSRLHVDRNVPRAFRARSKASFLESYALRYLEFSLIENEVLRRFAP